VSRMFRAGNTAPACRPPAGTVASVRVVGGRRCVSTLTVMVRNAQPPSQQHPRGASLGLPAEGPGSLAAFSTRVGAYLVDAVSAGLVTTLFVGPGRGMWSLATFAVLTVGTLVAFGQTPGQRLFGLRLAHPRQGERLALWRAVVRTALLCLLVPALLVDADGRGLHDRLTDTAVVRET
jgi:hypothetical protein